MCNIVSHILCEWIYNGQQRLITKRERKSWKLWRLVVVVNIDERDPRALASQTRRQIMSEVRYLRVAGSQYCSRARKHTMQTPRALQYASNVRFARSREFTLSHTQKVGRFFMSEPFSIPISLCVLRVVSLNPLAHPIILSIARFNDRFILIKILLFIAVWIFIPPVCVYINTSIYSL